MVPREKNYEIWRGPSLIDGQPVVMLATTITDNDKITSTGLMPQTWYLRADVDPCVALKTGKDVSICGSCTLRPKSFAPESGMCYVSVQFAPNNIYRRWSRGLYPKNPSPSDFNGLPLRLGAYGDPACVPFEVHDPLLEMCSFMLGYTSSWAICDPRLRFYCMASVKSPQEREWAKDMGWRTYRMRWPDDKVDVGEIVCPGSEEGGKRVSCDQCRICCGGMHGTDVVTINHSGVLKNPRTAEGILAKRKNYENKSND